MEPGAAGESDKPSYGYNVLLVRWHNSADAFDPAETLSAVAESHGYLVKHKAGKIPGRATLRIDTEASVAKVKRRKSQLLSPDARRALNKLFRSAIRDERMAPAIAALLARSQEGEDVSAELIKLLPQIPTSRDRG